MKTPKQIPCLGGWIAAVIVGFPALLPTYFYVRLVPALLALVIASYCLIQIWARKQPKPARICRRILTALVVIAVIICCGTGALILNAGAGDPHQDCAYIVVLGAQVNPDGPSQSLRERIYAARDYLDAHPNTVAILSGGQGDDEHITEAQCMYDELIKLGIPAHRLIKEDRAASTWGNLSYSLDIIEAQTGHRPDSVGVVSSEYHLFRTGLQAKRHGLQIVGIPAKTGTFDRFLHYFIREIAGVWHYLIIGGQYT